jgi:hemoglobin/transferrin/lactoferrin receptor protein
MTPRRCGRPSIANVVPLFVFAVLAARPRTQGEPPPNPVQRPEAQPVVVTASRGEQDPFEAPYAIDTVGEERVRNMAYRTLPQALRELPSTMIQETAPGQGSPFLRGFTGYNNLLLIDGVRLNNSVFRAGPNQYWATVDPLSVSRIEVLRGPAGALYGSDAVGGTVQVFTRSPTLFGERAWQHGGGLYGRFASAEDSVIGRAELQAGIVAADGSATGFLIGGDAKSFGELSGGHGVGLQPNTDHHETAFDFKVEHWFDANSRLVLLHQNVSQNNVPRTHATTAGISWYGTTVGTDLRRDLDQDRQLTYLQYHRTGMGGALDGMHVSVSWHEQAEFEDRIVPPNSQREQGFTCGTLGLSAQFDSDLGTAGRLTFGAEWYHDNVNSFFRRATGAQPADPIQGPVANDAAYDLLGVYVQDIVPLGEAAELILGGRYTYAAADAGSVRDPATSTKTSLSDHWDDFAANARLRVDLVEEQWNVFAGVSQGFRAPNLSDLTTFDTARSGEAEVSSTDLEPEEYLGYEIGSKVRCADVTAQAAWFYTDIEGQILRFPTGTTNASGQPIVTKANVGDGYVEGAELQVAWELIERTTVFGVGSWQYGRVSNFNSGGTTRTEEFVSRLMPLTALVGARWHDAEERLHAEVQVLHAEDADKTSAGDNRDTQRIPPGGTPGYTLANVRVGWQIDERARVDLGLDNLTDVDYRVHGSGSNSPGRSFVMAMSVTF